MDVDWILLDQDRDQCLRQLFYPTTLLTSILEIYLWNLSRHADLADSPKSL